MLNRWSWLALGFGAYLAFTLASFPAATAYRWFVPEPVKLTELQGTLWTGQAASGSVSNVAFSDVRWHVHPLSLLIGRLSAEVQARLTGGFVSASVSATRKAVELTDLKAGTTLPALRAALPLAGLRGLASLDVARLRLENGWPKVVVGRLSIANLQIPPLDDPGSQALVPLGNYEIDFDDRTPTDRIAATFKDTGGPLEVSGTLALDSNRAYTIDGLIKPRADAPAELVQGLVLMTSEPDAQGRRKLHLPGTL